MRRNLHGADHVVQTKRPKGFNFQVQKNRELKEELRINQKCFTKEGKMSIGTLVRCSRLGKLPLGSRNIELMQKIRKVENIMKNHKAIKLLFDECANCTLCSNLTAKRKGEVIDNSLINIFQENKLFLNIPSIWTDWLNRSESKIMIVGQDWGPYCDMVKMHNDYLSHLKKGIDDWIDMVSTPESMTNKLMTSFIINSGQRKGYNIDKTIMNSIYVTNAVLCGRQGNNYRGNDNFNAKLCTENCSSNLNKQIEILKPMIVITLGYWPFYSIGIKNNINVYKTLKENLDSYNGEPERIINIGSITEPTYIIPVYHPVAQVKKEDQLKYYEAIWDLLFCKRESVDDITLADLNTYSDYRNEETYEKNK